MKKLWLMLGLVVLALAVLIFNTINRKTGEYHLREFERMRTNFNTFQPQAKWDYHLRRLEELGVVNHTNLVFTRVPYTKEASHHIWYAAYSNFPSAVMFTANYFATNDAAYGVRPYVMEVWDFPSNSLRWSSFFDAYNHQP